MNKNRVRLIHVLLILIVYGLIGIPASSAQIGIQIPVYTIQTHSDSSMVSYSKPVLPLRNWQDHSDKYFQLKQENSQLDISLYISPTILPRDPFKVDMRGTSNYVPRMVRDELNLIMNRPRDNAFVPILPAAFLALQLASKYLLVQKKTEITFQDIENGKDGVPLLKELWTDNPQTLTELYKKPDIKENYTMLELQKLVKILIDNKLVKRKLIENSETKYFYALDKIKYEQLIEKVRKDVNDMMGAFEMFAW